jgi:hypothetical protein
LRPVSNDASPFPTIEQILPYFFCGAIEEQFYGMWKIAFESSRLGGDLRRAKEVKK